MTLEEIKAADLESLKATESDLEMKIVEVECAPWGVSISREKRALTSKLDSVRDEIRERAAEAAQ